MAQSSHALKQLMTFCCGDREYKCFFSIFGKCPCVRQMTCLITLNCSACSLACMFLCAALRSPNICVSFVSKLKRQRHFKTVTQKKRWWKCWSWIGGKYLTIYDNMMRWLLWHTSCTICLTRGTIWQSVGMRTKKKVKSPSHLHSVQFNLYIGLKEAN